MIHRWGHRGGILVHLWPKLYHLLSVRTSQARSCRAIAAAHAVPLEHLPMIKVRLRGVERPRRRPEQRLEQHLHC